MADVATGAAPVAAPAPAAWTEIRRRTVLHFVGIALTCGAAKAVLYTLALVLFLAREGPEQLPLFYIAFAGMALIVSAWFSAVVDSSPAMVLVRATVLASALIGLCLWLLLIQDAHAVYFLLLAGAHIFDIITDIVFWVAAGSYLTSREMKRTSTWLFLAWAAGGAAGGVLANALLQYLPPQGLMLPFLLLTGVTVLQSHLAEGRLVPLEGDDDGDDRQDGVLASLRALPGLVADYPFALLLASASLLMMLLFCVSEYLWASVYVATFSAEGELAAFVAKIYVATQVAEFVLLIAANRTLLERTGPLLRNLIFPLTSLGCLIAFALSPRLHAAIAVNVNAEAVSNAVFEPVNNANYAALPRRFQGRVRTLADGVFYPMGMAAAGLVLWWSGSGAIPLFAVVFAALLVALLFLAVNVALGSLFLPTLLRTLRSGIVHFAEVADQLQLLTSPADAAGVSPPRARPGQRTFRMLAPRRRSEPERLLDDLPRIAACADRSTRRQVVDLLRGLPEGDAAPLVRDLLCGTETGGQLVALQYLLGRDATWWPAEIESLAAAPSAEVAALARLVLASEERTALERLAAAWQAGDLPTPEIRAVVLDAIGSAGRADLAPVLIALGQSGSTDEIEQALTTLGERAAPDDTDAADYVRGFATHADPRLRAAAAGALTRFEGLPSADGSSGLCDRHRLVRRRATVALVRHGDAAVDALAERLSDPDIGVVRAAVRTLGTIGSRRAVAVLRTFVAERSAAAVRHLHWLDQIAGTGESARYRVLRFVLEESNRRTLRLGLDVLAALGPDRVVRSVARLIESDDPRRRADAIEALLASRHGHLVGALMPLLEAFDRPLARSDDPEAMLRDLAAAAARDPDPWVRAAARQLVPTPGSDPTQKANPALSAPAEAEVAEAHLQRVLFLKSIPLFRQLPLDTLAAIAEVLRERRCAAGERIVRAGSTSAELFVLERGAVTVRRSDTELERLRAPALFGEEALVEDLVWSRDVDALEPCSLLAMHRTVFEDLANDHPEIVVELSRLLARRREDRVAMPDRPSIAVLPFGDQSAGTEQAYLADGIAEDLITALSKYRWFLVIARNSTFTFKGADQEPRQVATALGVRYVLSGSVRRAGGRVRITAQLVDATAGHQVWAERFDRELDDIFAVQDEITASIVAAVAPEFLSAETRRAKREDVRNLNAWEHVMRARWHHARCTAQDFVETHALLARALALDPVNVGAHCLEAFVYLAEIQFGWTRSPEEALAAAERAARTAVDLDPREAFAHTALGFVDLMARRYDDAVRRLEHAVSLNPNLAIAQGGLGQAYALSGDYQPAIAQIQKAIRLSPEDPFTVYWYGHLGLAAFAAGRYEEAADWGAKAVHHHPESPAGHRLRAASLAQLGRLDEAREALHQLLQRMPGMTAADVRRQVPYKRDADTERYIDGLKKAGLPA